jgi:hypothetical protein
LNTPGGDVVAATHIANLMRDQREHKGRAFEVLIEGAAWSAGTIITSAGKPTKMADNALMFVHDPWTRVTGNARELRKAAEASDKFRDAIVATYRWKSPLEPEDLVDLMANDTWMDADEALAKGFIDEKIEGVSAAALFDAAHMPKLESVPEKYRARVQALLRVSDQGAVGSEQEAESSEQGAESREREANGIELVEDPAVVRAEASEIVKLCAKYGLPEMAAEFFAKGARLADVEKRFIHADQIRNRCAAAQMAERATRFIAADMTPEEVSDALTKIKLALDGPEIDNKQPGESGTPSAKEIDFNEIYALRRKKAAAK